MIITFSPQNRPERLTVRKSGDALTINGEVFDFTSLPAGATLPRSAINSTWFAGDVERDSEGVLTVPLIVPHGSNAPQATRFPGPASIAQDGDVAVPAYEVSA